MKIFVLLSVLLLFPSLLHTAENLNAEKPKRGFFDKAPCTPSLHWPKAEDSQTAYDVIVYEALSARDQAPAPGKEVFYKEKLDVNSIRLPYPLEENKKYLWTYRYRKNNKTSSWASYSKKYNHIIAWGELQGLYFGFETKNCPNLSKASSSQNAKIKVSDAKTYKKLASDDQIASLLESGMSGIVLPYAGYTYGKKDAEFIQSAKSVEEMQSKLKSHDFDGSYLIVHAPRKNKEEKLSPNKEKFLILIGEPGEYIVTYWVVDIFVQTISLKLDLKIPVEAGKLKYVGDMTVLALRDFGLSNFKALFSFKPDVFINFMKEKYPKTSPYIVFDKEKK